MQDLMTSSIFQSLEQPGIEAFNPSLSIMRYANTFENVKYSCIRDGH